MIDEKLINVINEMIDRVSSGHIKGEEDLYHVTLHFENYSIEIEDGVFGMLHDKICYINGLGLYDNIFVIKSTLMPVRGTNSWVFKKECVRYVKYDLSKIKYFKKTLVYKHDRDKRVKTSI